MRGGTNSADSSRQMPSNRLFRGTARRRVRRWAALHGNLFGVVPILVYQMAKVGSSSIVAALEELGLPVFHVHRMDEAHLHAMREARRARGWETPPIPPHDHLGLRIRRHLLDRGGRARIITLVRDPIARNFSSYFEHLDQIWQTRDAHAHVPIAALTEGFLTRFTHEEPLTWFDDEMLRATGIDVYQHPFPAAGHQTIRTDRFDLLILKSELPDAKKAVALAAFLGRSSITLAAKNQTSEKAVGLVFRQFANAIRLDGPFVDRMLESRYARHFYTDAEREDLRRTYAVRGGSVLSERSDDDARVPR